MRDINWDYVGDAVPAFLTLIVIPLTYKFVSSLLFPLKLFADTIIASHTVLSPASSHTSSSTASPGPFAASPTTASFLPTLKTLNHGSSHPVASSRPGCTYLLPFLLPRTDVALLGCGLLPVLDGIPSPTTTTTEQICTWRCVVPPRAHQWRISISLTITPYQWKRTSRRKTDFMRQDAVISGGCI